MDYHKYAVEEFAMDERFQRWVQHPDPESELFWQTWLEKNPHKQAEVEQARQLVQLLQFQVSHPTSAEQAQVWNRLQATRTRQRSLRAPERRGGVRQVYQRWRALAAMVSIALLGGWLYYAWVHQPLAYTTEYGQTKQVELPDGSTVMLNAHSVVRLSADWREGRPREVWLRGEAFFKVVKKSQRTPFIVHTDDLNVQVLGTQFNVASRQGSTKVVLNSGKIKLDLAPTVGSGSLLMAPGELVELSSTRKAAVKRVVDPALYSDWTSHQWILQNTTLAEVTTRLEETFGLTVVYESPEIAQERMSGIVSTENLEDLLDALSTINGLRMTKTKNQLRIAR